MAAALQHSLPASGVRRPSFGTSRSSQPQGAAAATAFQPCLQLQYIQAVKQQRTLKPHLAQTSSRVQQRSRQQHVCHASLRPLEVSSSIAAARAAENSRPDALFQDPYAATLCGRDINGSSGSSNEAGASQAAVMDVVATQYIDESLANAMEATSINSIQDGDYRQVVLLGDGFDTRPFRLMWPPGTLLFSVAPAEVHEQAEAHLAAAQPPAHVQRGCLLRRVNMNLKPAVAAAASAAADTAAAKSDSSSSGGGGGGGGGAEGGGGEVLVQQGATATVFREQLSRAGFRADRLSVWVFQGLHDQGIGSEVLRQLLAEVADSAAFHSLIVGELPGPLTRQDADNLLAEAGLLGAVYDYATADAGQYKRWQEGTEQQTASSGSNSSSSGGSGGSSSSSSSSGGAEGEVAPRWICAGQQLRLSLAQMGIYDEWSSEFEEADFGDDFIGNVS